MLIAGLREISLSSPSRPSAVPMRLLNWVLRTLAHLLLRKQVLALHRNLLRLRAPYRQNLSAILPTNLRQALIAAEDHRFFNHGGVDPIALVRAIVRFHLRGRLQGASTIEQQLVRTVTMRYDRTVLR